MSNLEITNDGIVDSSLIKMTIGSSDLVKLDATGIIVGDTSTKNATAVLEVKSTSQGVLIPRMTNAQLTGLSTPATGLIGYDTTNKQIMYYDTAWISVTRPIKYSANWTSGGTNPSFNVTLPAGTYGSYRWEITDSTNSHYRFRTGPIVVGNSAGVSHNVAASANIQFGDGTSFGWSVTNENNQSLSFDIVTTGIDTNSSGLTGTFNLFYRLYNRY